MKLSAPSTAIPFCVSCIAASLIILIGCPLQAQTISTDSSPNAPAANSSSPPPEVMQALQMPEGPDQAKTVGAAATQWAKNDPYGFVIWAASQPPKIFGLVRASAPGCGQSAVPQNAANWIVQQDTPQAKQLLHMLLGGWTKADSTAATAWCTQEKYGSTDMRYLAYFSLGDDLCRKDPAVAAAWAAQLPPGNDRLAAVHGIALIWARGDVIAATAWIKQLNLQDMKRAAQAVAETWKSAKGASGNVEDWVNQLSLSATDKDDVLKGPRPDEFNYSKYQSTPPSPAL